MSIAEAGAMTPIARGLQFNDNLNLPVEYSSLARLRRRGGRREYGGWGGGGCCGCFRRRVHGDDAIHPGRLGEIQGLMLGGGFFRSGHSATTAAAGVGALAPELKRGPVA